MKIITAVAAILITAGASAQQVSEAEQNARLNIAISQRNQAQDTVIVLQARVAMLEQELKSKDCPKPKAESK